MATRTRLVFLTFPEFAEWLRETTRELDYEAIVLRFQRSPTKWGYLPLERWDGRDESLAGNPQVYLTASGLPDLATIPPAGLIPGKLGWMQLAVPQVENGCLCMIQPGVKSDWYESETRRILENPTAIKVFERFWRKWKKHFTMGMIVRDRVTGAEGRYSVGYSAGTAEWFQSGGCLRESGGGNNEYIIPSKPS